MQARLQSEVDGVCNDGRNVGMDATLGRIGAKLDGEQTRGLLVAWDGYGSNIEVISLSACHG